MMNISEYFWSNIGTNLVLTGTALIIAIIFVIVLERYFNITLKNPVNLDFSIRDPVGKIPGMKDPVGKFR